ncbi:IS30 family transposase, partial [Acetobacter sp. DsW_063]|uniref:IS30 family transposase n=1 Tax=Acetobacter sp. DsW_063 TaxID=1514894 RepID=UPI002101876A
MCDQGSEFVTFNATERKTGMTVWFCDPRSPWQKGSVENTNGRLRLFLPMDTALPSIGPAALRAIEARMNATPRKCLGYLTPAEAMDRFIESFSP